MKRLGRCCMILGVLLLAGALVLVLYNQREASRAQQAADSLMPQLMDQIQQNAEVYEPEPTIPVDLPEIGPETAPLAMKTVEIDGHTYIGYLAIPALGLELPMMADWSYPQLRISPCRYTGTLDGDDLVLMAHNYARHFGKISNLNPGDSVYFTDVDGVVTAYQVVASDILHPQAVEEMTAGHYDLTLFTCTYGGKTRVTIYCDRAEA